MLKTEEIESSKVKKEKIKWQKEIKRRDGAMIDEKGRKVNGKGEGEK